MNTRNLLILICSASILFGCDNVSTTQQSNQQESKPQENPPSSPSPQPKPSTPPEEKKPQGKLVGAWLDSYNTKAQNRRIGQKIVMMEDGKFYFGSCALDDEQLDIGSLSDQPYSEIVFDGKAWIDMNIPDQKLVITKTGDLKIYDVLGLVDTYTYQFIDPTVIKR